MAVEDYRVKGFLKEALVNFVALLGWNAGDDKEFYNMNELIDSFSLERVNKSGAVFDLEKLNWLNAEHLRRKTQEEILALLKDELKNSEFSHFSFSDEYLVQIISAMKERVSFVKEFITKSPYFFDPPKFYEEAAVQKNWKDDTGSQLKILRDEFAALADPSKEGFEHALASTAEKLGIGKGKLIHPLRLSVSGMSTGPGVFDIVMILGKEETLKRIDTALEKIK